MIGELLKYSDLNSLIQTSRRFALVLDSTLYDIARDHFTFHDEGWGYISVLEWTSFHGKSSTLEKLLAKKVDLSVTNGNKRTALHNAASRGHKTIVQILLDAGMDPSSILWDGEMPLHRASYQGESEIIQLILAAGSDVSALGALKRTALHRAAINGNVEAIQILLQAGADVLVSDQNGDFLLTLFRGHKAAAEMLLEAGSDISVKNRSEGTALLHSCHSGDFEVIQFVVEVYKAMGMSLQERDRGGKTPLHVTARSGHEAASRVLIENGIDVMKKFDGYTPLHIAALKGHESVVKLLLEKDADVDACDGTEKIPVYLATGRGHASVVRLLLQHGADATLAERKKWATPLHEATTYRYFSIAEALVDHGADLSAANKYGWAPLHLSAEGGDRPTLDMLMRKAMSPEILRKTIVNVAITELLKPDEGGTFLLARLLVFAKVLPEARVAFKRLSSSLGDWNFTCDLCAGIIKDEFRFCYSCPNVNLCSPCEKGRREDTRAGVCRDHEFAFIHLPSSETISEERVNEQGELRTNWLSRLLDTYLQPAPAVMLT